MSVRMPTITVRVSELIVAAIDTELHDSAHPALIARPTRSDWVRSAIESKLAECAKRRAKRKPSRFTCAYCHKPICLGQVAQRWKALTGEPEVACFDCVKTRFEAFTPPK